MLAGQAGAELGGEVADGALDSSRLTHDSKDTDDIQYGAQNRSRRQGKTSCPANRLDLIQMKVAAVSRRCEIAGGRVVADEFDE